MLLMDYLNLKVTEIITETADTLTIRLQPEDDSKLKYEPGQFLTFIFNRHSKEIRRSFSLSSSPDTDPIPAITIKRIVNGEISGFLHHHISKGDVLRALYPSGRFTLAMEPSLRRDVFLIAAGSGITPVFSILKSLLIREPLSRVTLIYSNRNEKSTIFYNELNELAKQYSDRFTCIYIFSDPDDKTYRYWAHLNIGLLEELIRENMSFEKEKAVFMLCGPFTFMRMAEMIIIAMHFDESAIHKENFVLMQQPETISMPAIEDRSDKKLTIRYRGKTYVITVPYGVTILKAAMNNGIHLPYSCQGAICGICAGICREGKIQMPVNFVLGKDDISKGWVLTCVGYVATSQALLEFK